MGKRHKEAAARRRATTEPAASLLPEEDYEPVPDSGWCFQKADHDGKRSLWRHSDTGEIRWFKWADATGCPPSTPQPPEVAGLVERSKQCAPYAANGGFIRELATALAALQGEVEKEKKVADHFRALARSGIIDRAEDEYNEAQSEITSLRARVRELETLAFEIWGSDGEAFYYDPATELSRVFEIVREMVSGARA
jgi:hypothetical protein